MITLRGMTWDHPRGYDPLLACAQAWQESSGVQIVWDRRSLQDFESYPVEELARKYDLIVIDHPHLGQVTRETCLLPLDSPGRARDLAILAAQSVGPSFESYRYDGQLWALPLDAATQIQAWRPDLLDAPAFGWDDVMALAAVGRVLCPLRPPHALMAFFSLMGNLGHPPVQDKDRRLIDPCYGVPAYERLRELAACINPQCFRMDPIAVYERMAQIDSTAACAPLIYGYVNYGCANFRPARIAFADIPALGPNGPAGTTLGGTGIAVSARSTHAGAAADFAFWAAGAEVQRGIYAQAGGQPGNAVAWDDALLDRAAGGFYSATRATLAAARVRPRHAGYMRFQVEGSMALNACLQSGESSDSVVARLNRMFKGSFMD